MASVFCREGSPRLLRMASCCAPGVPRMLREVVTCVQVEDAGDYLDVLSVESTLATWERAFDDKGLMSSARPSRVTTTASWLRGFWSKNSVMMLGMMSLGRVTCDV